MIQYGSTFLLSGTGISYNMASSEEAAALGGEGEVVAIASRITTNARNTPSRAQ
eukprot:TRINITY_DN1209_c0_g1_i1.p1 TRINITY_DN1209_c0_g1~~TRINITY_DN1209_c0_g1_i1.p1  ORF type:complete len:54 (-),score=1.92 TRINITY_DN1209_c0_g1_i1:31-192(-)